MKKTVWRLMGAIDTTAVGCPLCGGEYQPKKQHYCPEVKAIVMWTY